MTVWTQLLDRLLEEAEHFGARHGVEVAGRFVGEDDGWLADQCACDGDALLLAA
jgi:hypothetical protein